MEYHKTLIDSIESVLSHFKLFINKSLDVLFINSQVFWHNAPHAIIKMKSQEFMIDFLFPPIIHNFAQQFWAEQGQKFYRKLEVCLFWLVWKFVFSNFQQVFQSGSLIFFNSKKIFGL
jgi:hypothetical protein